MGKAASAAPKDGYEAVSVVDAADEAQQFLTSSKGAAKPAKAAVPEEMRAWEGRLWHCFGRCDSTSFGACGLSYFLPCVAFGLNMRRGLLLSALKQALIFGILVALSWSLNAVRVASIVAECPPPLHHMHGRGHGSRFGRHFGPEDFGHVDSIRAPIAQAMDPRDFAPWSAPAEEGVGIAISDSERDAPLSGPMTTLAAAVSTVDAAGKEIFNYDGPARPWQDWAAMRDLAVKVIGQRGEVLPEDKAAAHALGLCLKAKHHGAFVRFKQAKQKLKEKKLEHKSMAAKTAVKHAVVHLEDMEGLPRAGPKPWWAVALGKGARKHVHGHGQLKTKPQAEEVKAVGHKLRNLLHDDEDHDDDEDDHDDDDDHDDEDDQDDDDHDEHHAHNKDRGFFAGIAAHVKRAFQEGSTTAQTVTAVAVADDEQLQAVPEAIEAPEAMSPVSDLRTAEMPGLPGPGGHSDAMDDAMELARDFRADIHRVFAGHMTREHMEECRRLQGMACQISMAFLLYFVGLTIYAARRRTELRERFNIAGSKMGDFCAWLWCPIMALCQETRTLAANNVEAGVWHGRVPSMEAVEYSAATPPKVNVMSIFEAPKGSVPAPVDTVRMV